jgi:glycolate oxidase
MIYNSVDSKIVSALQTIVGINNVITDKTTLENYSHDETPIYRAMPEVAVKPRTAQEVSKIMKLAYGHTIAVTARGGGTSLSAGAVPIHSGIVLSLEQMNTIKEIDEKNLMVVTEPGIITEQLENELAKRGFFFPPDPVSLDSCTIGGNIAENAGGPRAMKYGVTKNYVTGLEVVLADGTIVRLGGKLYKNVTGYDLIDVLIGSEGTLAIVTEATLKVLPLPKVVVDLLIPFRCVEDASQFSLDLSQGDIMPAAIEFMDGDVYRIVAQYLKRTLPFSEAGAHIIVELDGNHKEQIQNMYNRVGDIALKYGCLDVFVGESIKDKEKIWEPRKTVGDALKELSKIVAREDLVVPKDQISRLISTLKECVEKYNVHLFAFGHFGDGNIHADFGMIDDSDKKEDYSDRGWVDKMRKEVYTITLSLSGTITAEHGIGLSKIPYLSMALDTTQISIMKKIKNIFDPKNILNPGKIFASQ